MRRSWVAICFGLGFVAAAVAGPAHVVDLEAGWVFPGYNDVRIPGDTGTKLSLTEELSADPFPAGRARYLATLAERHDVGLLAAFLTMRSDGSVSRVVHFADASFPVDTPLSSTFRFNSYRLLYRYHVMESDTLRFRAGCALKVRDAAIRLEGGGRVGEKTDLGVVPLLSFSLVWRAHPALHLSLDGEALASPQGRAEDVLLAATTPLTDHVSFNAGYRILEGGADNDTVYTFSLFHYAVAGLTMAF